MDAMEVIIFQTFFTTHCFENWGISIGYLPVLDGEYLVMQGFQ